MFLVMKIKFTIIFKKRNSDEVFSDTFVCSSKAYLEGFALAARSRLSAGFVLLDFDEEYIYD